jgi:hypothetical protein
MEINEKYCGQLLGNVSANVLVTEEKVQLEYLS